MKVRAAVKKRSEDCKIVRRKGKIYIINKRILSLNNVRVKKKGQWHVLRELTYQKQEGHHRPYLYLWYRQEHCS